MNPKWGKAYYDLGHNLPGPMMGLRCELEGDTAKFVTTRTAQ